MLKSNSVVCHSPLTAICSLLVLVPFSPLFGQNHEWFRSDAAISALGTFSTGTEGQGRYLGPQRDFFADHSLGLLVSYHYRFTAYQAVEADYSHTAFNQQYGLIAIGAAAGIDTRLHEATASYVLGYTFKRFTPYLSLGGSVVFHPLSSKTPFGTEVTPVPTTQVRPSAVYGGGLGIRITKHVSLRAGYRGVLCSAPDFDVPGLKTYEITHFAEPHAGFAYAW
ncbi:MAG TPA: outer membrane beta-barrel protein [Bryobacteraceae bacterium]|nr:outer membrane beta-barrel protein [Bryobacteraceae bacterium]